MATDAQRKFNNTYRSKESYEQKQKRLIEKNRKIHLYNEVSEINKVNVFKTGDC